jgi:hypothetical protein
MIMQLFRTEIRSDLAVFGSFALLGAAPWVAQVALLGAPMSVFVLLVGTTAFVAGGVAVYTRHREQRRTRLLTQLPVTSLQVSVARWCATLTRLAVPFAVIAVFLAVAPPPGATLPQVLRAFLALYFAATFVVAAIALVETARALGRVHFRVAIVAWCIVMLATIVQTGVFVSREGMFRLADGEVDWRVLLPSVLAAGPALVLIDIWLRQRAENYLR